MPQETDFAQLSRRHAIGATVLGALSLPSLAHGVDPNQSSIPTPARKRSIRLAHLTDVHVQPERGAEAGLAKCLAHMQSQTDKPELVITGGDHVMDVFEQKRPRADLVGKLWRDIVKRECSLRIEPTIGNHDIWGWDSKSGAKPTDAGFGKSFALELLGLEKPYRSFALNGWHVIVLDSIQRRGDDYACELDSEQMAWLKSDLAAKPAATPALVVSHAPILSLTGFASGDARKDDALSVSGSLTHLDGFALHQLLRSKNVRLCLSGHIHLLDRCAIDGVTYICGGAVSGSWWKGPHKGVAEGYGLVDLYDDGSFEHRYITYGWTAKA